MPDQTRAHEVMRTKLVTAKPDMSVMQVVELLLKHKISGAPVLDASGNLVGIISELDCVNHISHAAMNGVPLRRVQDLMTRDVETVSPDATLLTLVHIFSHKRYRRVPVVDERGHMLGQISRRDVMKALYEKMEHHHSHKDGPLYLSALDEDGEAPAKLR